MDPAAIDGLAGTYWDQVWCPLLDSNQHGLAAFGF